MDTRKTEGNIGKVEVWNKLAKLQLRLNVTRYPGNNHRKQQQKLKEEKAAIELTVQRQLDTERKKISEEAGQKAAEEQQLKMREKDDLIKSMQQQIEALKRKAETGSQERQGEALEGIRILCNRHFPMTNLKKLKKASEVRIYCKLSEIIPEKNVGKSCGSQRTQRILVASELKR